MPDETYIPARRHSIRKSMVSRRPCPAKQSQFPAERAKANCRSEKGLGKEVWMPPPEKTKPICPAGLVRAVPVRAFVETQYLASPSATASGPIVQNKANFPIAQVKANCRSGRRLGKKHADYAPAKTKPISSCPGMQLEVPRRRVVGHVLSPVATPGRVYWDTTDTRNQLERGP